MKLNSPQSILALGLPIGVVQAIPPADFGFPQAPDDAVLPVAFSQRNGSYTRVDPGILFGIEVAQSDELNDAPQVALNMTASNDDDNDDESYLVLLVDPDASYPESPNNRFILHYLQANLTIDDSSPERFRDSNLEAALPGVTWLVNNSAPFIPYAPPRPPTNSSAHRYIFYAFEQPDAEFQIPESFADLSPDNRARFNLTRFIDEAGLGEPIAANYFYASSQSSVPPRYIAPPGGEYPEGNGDAVTSGDPGLTAVPSPTGSQSGSGAGGGEATSTTSPGIAAQITAMGSLMGAGLMGLVALL